MTKLELVYIVGMTGCKIIHAHKQKKSALKGFFAMYPQYKVPKQDKTQ